MFSRKLAYLGIFAGAVSMGGCSSDDSTTTKPKDFSIVQTNKDGGTGTDAAAGSYTAATPNQIDTATIGDTYYTGASVKLTGLVVTTPVNSFEASSHTKCKYEVWAQDPQCTAPPCGILLITQPIPKPTGAQYCPYADQSGTILANTRQGDVVTVEGVVDNYATSATAPATGTVNQHEVDMDTMTTTSTGQTLPTPITVTDTVPSMFVPYSGSGWAMYEATYVKLVPPSSSTTFTVSAFDQYGNWTLYPTTGGAASTGAEFADTFKFVYSPKDAGTGPTAGATYTKMGGVVTLGFGGTIDPIESEDFTH